MKTDTVFETLKEWVVAANPGFVTQQDLARVEKRLDELMTLVETLERKVRHLRDTGGATAKGGGKHPRPPQ